MSNNRKRVAWVTGGGSGIGEAGAEALAADGWMVVVSGRRKEALDAVVAKIAKGGCKAEAIALDVGKAPDVDMAAGQILERYGRIDLLVNSAGINVPRLRRQHAAAGMRERDPDQPDLEQGLRADAGEQGLVTGL